MKNVLVLAILMALLPAVPVVAGEAASPPGCPDRKAIRAEEKWALLIYQVGPNRSIDSVEVPYASDPAYQAQAAKEAREGGVFAPVPGKFRTFRFEPPAGMQASEPDRKLLHQALSGMSGPLTGDPVSADLAVRIELNAEGRLTGWEEIFSTRPGIAPQLKERAETFLTQSGLREGGTPGVVAIYFTVQDGRVVSAASSGYRLAC